MRERISDNKGFSLVELIVAVLILGILSTLAAVSLGQISGAKVDAAIKTTGSIIKQTREKAMALTNEEVSGKTDVYAYLYLDNGTVYGEVRQGTNVIAKEKICSNKLSVKFLNHKRPLYYWDMVLANGMYAVKIYFKKSSGGIAGIYTVDASGVESLLCNYTDAEGNVSYCDSIEIVGPGEEQKLILVQATGRCYIDSDFGTTPTPSGSPTPEPTEAPESEE